jgi:hypothetical protein
MSSFFSSELVREEMENITKLQQEIYQKVFEFSTMNRDDKLEHVEKLGVLLDKQRILYTRLKLSDDPEAQKMKDRILQEAVALGFPKDVDITYVFSNMTKVLDQMKKSILDNP